MAENMPGMTPNSVWTGTPPAAAQRLLTLMTLTSSCSGTRAAAAGAGDKMTAQVMRALGAGWLAGGQDRLKQKMADGNATEQHMDGYTPLLTLMVLTSSCSVTIFLSMSFNSCKCKTRARNKQGCQEDSGARPALLRCP